MAISLRERGVEDYRIEQTQESVTPVIFSKLILVWQHALQIQTKLHNITSS